MPVHPDDLYQRFSSSFQSSAEAVWKEFSEQMPPHYFRETTEEMQLSHLHMLTASAASGVDQDLVVRSQDGATWTYLTGRSRPGQLGEFLSRLPRNRPLASARAYTSRDGRWVIDVFEFVQQRSHRVEPEELETRLPELAEGLPQDQWQSFQEHLSHCEPGYLKAATGPVAQNHYRLVEKVRRSGNPTLTWESVDDETMTVRLVIEGRGARRLFERVARYLGHRSVDIERAYVTSFGNAEARYRYLGFRIQGVEEALMDELTTDLARLHYLPDGVLDLWESRQDWSLCDCEISHFLVSAAHQALVSTDSLRYSRGRLEEMVSRHSALSSRLIKAFYHAARHEVWEQTPIRRDLGAIDSPATRTFFEVCLQVIQSLQRCNLEVAERHSLAARLEARFLCEPSQPAPFAVIYAVGRGFEGFHVRFQDAARGGLRLVRPGNAEAHALEGERIFQEAYALAYAQHLKNKDIPEGGAKAVVLMEPGFRAEAGGRAFADALLDLTLGEEFLYLGPDENVSNELIEWIVERAERRGHPLPATFMSSKPGAGINHKAYGITSEGVTVYLEVALREMGLDPASTPFTVKMTGGPDGDVAGNELKILLHRYPETARIVGVADGSGCAEDPQGLDRDELLRLVDQVLPIAHFDPSKLGAQGRVVSVGEPHGVQLRNTMHNRVKSDAFVPAGGRPDTLDDHNWSDFLEHTGEPTSPLIVEGANLFLTARARHELSRRGVTIIKDSSANKCGVICSSFEILASMLLSQDEFLKHKQVFVDQVIERLRELARLEAELLFQERRRRPDLTLPDLSIKLSQVLLRTAEAVATSIGDPLEDERFGTLDVLLEHLTPLLRDLARDRVERIPLQYRQRIVACRLAGKIVYREGITYLEDLPQEALQELAITYLAGERSINSLIAQVRASGLPDADRISRLLELGGARTLTRMQGSL